MSFSGFEEQPGFEDQPAWGSPLNPADDIAQALRKEQILKEITAAQDDLRAMLGRVKSVQGEVNKLTTGNATLQMYIDNLTVQMAKRR